jgi:uncharacterized protein
MILALKQVFAAEGLKIDFDYELSLSGYEFPAGEFPFKAPVRVAGKVENRAGVVGLSANAEFDYHTRCNRCFEEITEHMTIPIENVLVKSLSGEGADDMLVVEDEQLDLDELVTAYIVLALPLKNLCREDCKGLCPACGKNLNEGDCGCVAKEAVSGLSQLKELLD